MTLSNVRISPTWISLLIFAIGTAVATSRSLAQSQPAPYYVVVGGFASRDNADHFTAYLLGQNYPARYAFNASRKLYYVYVRLTSDKQSARQFTYRLRLETEFSKAWIYNGTLEGNALAESAAVAGSPAAAEKAPEPAATAEPVQPVADMPATPAMADQPIASMPVAPEPAINEPVAAQPGAGEPAPPAEPVRKSFIFQLTSAADNQPVMGLVDLLESDADVQPEHYQANARVAVPAPATGKLVVICHLIGYKPAKRAINYNDPMKSLRGASLGDGQEVIIPIQLVPVDKGDYIELERVKFFENSAILTPESEAELQGLVNLMANPSCKIKLYGHTHSGESREITTLGSSSSLFALDPANNHTAHGSAKELSRQRAETVKAYLVSQGIAHGRIATKGYGAVLNVYEHAAANDRIEVEIVKN